MPEQQEKRLQRPGDPGGPSIATTVRHQYDFGDGQATIQDDRLSSAGDLDNCYLGSTDTGPEPLSPAPAVTLPLVDASLDSTTADAMSTTNNRSKKRKISSLMVGASNTCNSTEATNGASPASEQLPEASPVAEHLAAPTRQNSDDEIVYEKAAQNIEFDEAIDGMDTADGLSSSTSQSNSDDEENSVHGVSSNGATNAPFRQFFKPPQESDAEHPEKMEDDDASSYLSSSEKSEGMEKVEDEDASSSVSSSDESSIPEKVAAVPPSAAFPHETNYPDHILEMATPNRSYISWSDRTVSFQKSGGALFPDGYKKCTEIPNHPWICPVRSCRLVYKTHLGLLNHFKFTHRRAMFNDNMDGTLSLIGFYTGMNSQGKTPPVVVSKRPPGPNETSTVDPSMPQNKSQLKKINPWKPNFTSPADNGEKIVMSDVHPLPLTQMAPPAAALANNDPQSSQALWDYVRPFLKNHHSIPSKNWTRHVIHLPRVRDITWNDKRSKAFPFRDSHPRDVAALVVQVTGVEAPSLCTSCVAGNGPFIGCIMISPDATKEAKDHFISCANCYYHSSQSKCSHCADAVVRRSRDVSQLRAYNVECRSSEASHTVPPPERRRPYASLPTPRPTVASSSWPSPRLFRPDEIEVIEMASQDRPYKSIKGKDGETIPMHGALIPDGYDLDYSIPGHPWICPVRSCRCVFKRIQGLGRHFRAKHGASVFNDNQDGTLSQLGVYREPITGDHCRAIIISKRSPSKAEPAIAKATLQYIQPGKGAKPDTTDWAARIGFNQRWQKKISNSNLSAKGNSREIRNYIQYLLPQPMTELTDPLTKKLFDLPMVRAMQWRKPRRNHRLDDEWSQVVGLLVHLVGIEKNELLKECTCCCRGEGPFKGCQVLPAELALECPGHKWVEACANCIFIHQGNDCSIKLVPNQGAPASLEPATALATSTTGYTTQANVRGQNRGQNKRPHSALSGSEDKERLLSCRHYERLRNSNDDGDYGPLRSSTRDVMRRRESYPKTISAGNAPSKGTSSVLISAGQTVSDEFLDMEEWEIAPGHIRGSGVGQLNDVAFSKSYLETNQMVNVSPELSVRIETIKSGRTLDFMEDKSRTRYCTLANGKLRVSIVGQPEFTIGPHGLFQIKPGATGWAQNRLYTDSTLHISIVEEHR